jgi:hypothetical protein
VLPGRFLVASFENDLELNEGNLSFADQIITLDGIDRFDSTVAEIRSSIFVRRDIDVKISFRNSYYQAADNY